MATHAALLGVQKCPPFCQHSFIESKIVFIVYFAPPTIYRNGVDCHVVVKAEAEERGHVQPVPFLTLKSLKDV